MKLDVYNQFRILQGLTRWNVSNDWSYTLVSYLLNGLNPGGMMSAMIENNASIMLEKCHPMIQLDQLQSASSWIQQYFPDLARGSQHNVQLWQSMSCYQREQILIIHGVIVTEKQALGKILSGAVDGIVIPKWFASIVAQ